jgi:hypothetical protein
LLHFVSKNTRGATRTRLRWSSVEEAANLMAAYMVISSPVSIFDEKTPLTESSMPQAGQAVCDQCHIKADFHVLRDEAAEALHSLRGALLIGRNDLAQSRASRLNVAAASVGWLCRWRWPGAKTARRYETDSSRRPRLDADDLRLNDLCDRRFHHGGNWPRDTGS